MVRTDLFLKPVTQPSQITDRPAVNSPTTDLPQHRSTAKASSSTQPEPTTAQTSQRQLSSAFDTSRKESSSPSDYDSDSLSSDRPLLDIFLEEGELSEDQEANLSDHDQSLSEEQSYQEADTLNALRTAPLHLDTVFPDSTVKRAEEDIAVFDKGWSGSVYKGRRYHPYERQEPRKRDRPAWKNLSCSQCRKSKGKQQYSSRPAKGQQSYK